MKSKEITTGILRAIAIIIGILLLVIPLFLNIQKIERRFSTS